MKRKLGDGQTFLFSEHSGEYAINHKSQDLTKLLDQNKRLQQEDHHIKDELRLSARIPVTIYYEWKNKFGVDLYDKNHAQAVRKLLNSPDYRYLKTTKRII
jgi:mannosyltransferase OCH1-like enzyme|tara:strand:+ start:298 stop:600 length:303 start_codon:yes stop_codon:yes gene_type:complete